MNSQATRATRAQVELHIQRQRKYGERMTRFIDRPRPIELIATGVILAILFAMLHGGFV
jgi:hypothetical protein